MPREPLEPELDLDIAGRERVQQEAEEGITSLDTEDYNYKGIFKVF